MSEAKKFSRRSFCRSAAAMSAAVAVGAIGARSAQAATGITKEDMKYQYPSPHPGQECERCVYFKSPKSCGIVDGEVSPEGWCTAFHDKGG